MSIYDDLLNKNNKSTEPSWLSGPPSYKGPLAYATARASKTSTQTYDKLLGLNRDEQTISETSRNIAPTKYDSILGVNRLLATTTTAAQTNVEKQPTFWQNLIAPLKFTTGAVASGTVNAARTVAGTFERQINSRMRNPEQPLYKNIEKAVADIFSGDDIIGGLSDLEQALPGPFAYASDIGKNVGLAVSGQQTWKEAVKNTNTVSEVASLFNPQKAGMDLLLAPIEEDVRQWAGLNENTNEILRTIYSGLESTSSSAMAGAGGVGYYMMFLQSLRNTLEELWREEEATGVKYDKGKLVTYAVGSAGLDVGIELLFPVVGKAGSKIAKSSGIVGLGIKKLVGFLGKKAGKEAIAEVGEAAIKKVAKPTIKKTLLNLAKKANEEGLEEVITAFATGILAKKTIDPDKKWLGYDGEAIVDAKALSLAYLGGFVGGAFISTSESVITHKTRVREWVNDNADLTTEELSQPEKQAEMDSLINDALDVDEVVNEIREDSIKTMNKISESPDVLQSDAVKELQDYAINSPVETPILTMPAKAPASPAEPSQAQGGNIPLSQEQAATSGAQTVELTEERKAEIKSRRSEIKIQLKELTDKASDAGAIGLAGLTGAKAREFIRLTKEFAELTYEMTPKLRVNNIKSMEERKSTLNNDTIIAAHNDKIKNKTAFLAMEEAVIGVVQNADTEIDNIINGKNKDISGREFYDSFSNTRDQLRKQYGNTVTLYRAEGAQKSKATKNYATTEEFAKQFGNNVVKKEVPIDNIIAVNVGTGNYHELIVGSDSVIEKLLSQPHASGKKANR